MTALQKKLLSILIINWNGWNDIKVCLGSIIKSALNDYEIIVIDNGSVDNSVANIKKEYPEVKLTVNETNLGHTVAVNQGLKIVSGRYVLLLDSDTELSADTIPQLISFMNNNSDVSLAAPRTYNSDGTVQESARNLPSVMSGIFGRQSLLTRVFPDNRFSRQYLARDMLDASIPFQVEQVSAACMIFPRTLIDDAGLWDELFFAYWVDTDWCFTLNKLGKKIYCVPEAKIIHHENNSRKKKKQPKRIIWFHHGAYLLYRKHFTFGTLDPRAIFAFIALSCRTTLLLTSNFFFRG